MKARFSIVLAAMLLASCAAPQPHTRPTTRPLASPQDLPGLANFAQVSDVLYRGAQPTQEGLGRLKQMGVKTVVDLRGKSHYDETESLGLQSVHIPSSAADPQEQQIVQFLRIVQDSANQPVFVHGERGADRTGCYVAAYRMVIQGWSAADAQAEMARFGFDPFWKAIPEFLDRMDVRKVRREMNEPTTRKSPTTRTTAATSPR